MPGKDTVTVTVQTVSGSPKRPKTFTEAMAGIEAQNSPGKIVEGTGGGEGREESSGTEVKKDVGNTPVRIMVKQIDERMRGTRGNPISRGNKVMRKGTIK